MLQLRTVLTFVCGFFLASTAAQIPETRNEPPPAGSGRVSGRIVAADDGTPIKGADVHLYGVPDSQRNAGPGRRDISREDETDGNGRFEFRICRRAGTRFERKATAATCR